MLGADEFPAHAGMNRQLPHREWVQHGVPRTRGDEPSTTPASPSSWTEFPAHAGMNRVCASIASVIDRVPRTRGDEPKDGATGTRLTESSPHTRG